MQELEWLGSFDLGVPEIDGDHRTILELMKAVKAAAAREDPARCEQYLDRMLEFLGVHFAREEKLLANWHYLEVKQHANYHTELLKRAETVRQTCLANEGPESFEKCCAELISLLVDEVVRGDMTLKSFLEHSGFSLPH